MSSRFVYDGWEGKMNAVVNSVKQCVISTAEEDELWKEALTQCVSLRIEAVQLKNKILDDFMSGRICRLMDISLHEIEDLMMKIIDLRVHFLNLGLNQTPFNPQVDFYQSEFTNGAKTQKEVHYWQLKSVDGEPLDRYIETIVAINVELAGYLEDMEAFQQVYTGRNVRVKENEVLKKALLMNLLYAAKAAEKLFKAIDTDTKQHAAQWKSTRRANWNYAWAVLPKDHNSLQAQERARECNQQQLDKTEEGDESADSESSEEEDGARTAV
eukprot:TRINITY_DN19280_c0_g1_i1.p1 TRINITY_DN19280_c0_g1~~TRINITY_DN19280_c0_g1_i1.p1  ORF type:complete len:270 (-),score=32.96 TRINITY_DN19280_c0_g1_i1:311-1120(-)